MDKTFEKLVYEVTTSWAMIHHLDNSESAGPKSITALEDWRRRKKNQQLSMKIMLESC